MALNSDQVLASDPPLPQVSVVIPVYNGEADLPNLIEGLWAQTYPGDRVEYVLVNNNSGDRTPELLQSYAQASNRRGLTLKVIDEMSIQSSYAARNAGIKVAIGSILAFTDADCRPQPNWLEELVHPFQNDTGTPISIVAGEVVALPSCNWLERYAERQNTLSQRHTLAHPFLPYGQTANLAVRRQTLEKAGLFRPYLTTGGDADLCWRIQQHMTCQIYFAEQAIVRHRHRSTLSELRRQWIRYGRSNRYLHELHGVDLMRELSGSDYFYRWSRWLLKELPTQSLSILTQQAPVDSLLDTPLGLWCASARSAGQRQSCLPKQALQIDKLPGGSSQKLCEN